MAKSHLFGISCGWGPNKRSIKEVARDFWNCLFQLSKVDSIFSRAVLSKEGFKDFDFTIDEPSRDSVIDSIASAILEFSKSDIKKYEKDLHPDINFSRDFGFSWVATFYERGKECFSFSVIMGSNSSNGLNTLTFSRDYNKEFDWYLEVLRIIININDAKVGGVNLKGSDFLNAVENVKRPLGWITYFSNDYELSIPNDLQGIEYEHTERGKYLILTRKDFTVDKETYEAHKQKLLRVMEEIKQRVPQYSK